jgi:hypothetical protein
VLLERRLGIGRRALSPKLVDQTIAGDGFAQAQEEDCENTALTGAAERQLPLAVEYLERAENPEVERVRQAPNVPR